MGHYEVPAVEWKEVSVGHNVILQMKAQEGQRITSENQNTGWEMELKHVLVRNITVGPKGREKNMGPEGKRSYEHNWSLKFHE